MPYTAENKWIIYPTDQGFTYGVEAYYRTGNITELHGGFATFEEARSHRDRLLEVYTGYSDAKVVLIETHAVSV